MGKKDFVTPTDYARPYRPLPVRAFNLLGGASERFGSRLEADALVKHAARKTGLSDFGDDGHFEALQALLGSITAEAQLTATGRLLQKSRLTDALVHRLRIEQLLKNQPEIEDIDLGAIVLVTGLQRSGTTLLQRLLHSNPAIRGVSAAEMLDPAADGN